jgi:hypothetical protein
MKKFILLVFIVNFTSAQCEFNFKELTMSVFYNESAFNEYVSAHGYSIINSNIYECIDDLGNKSHIHKNLSNDKKTMRLSFITFSILSFIKIKDEMSTSNFQFVKETNIDGVKSSLYKLLEMNLLISVKSINNTRYYEFIYTYTRQNRTPIRLRISLAPNTLIKFLF